MLWQTAYIVPDQISVQVSSRGFNWGLPSIRGNYWLHMLYLTFWYWLDVIKIQVTVGIVIKIVSQYFLFIAQGLFPARLEMMLVLREILSSFVIRSRWESIVVHYTEQVLLTKPWRLTEWLSYHMAHRGLFSVCNICKGRMTNNRYIDDYFHKLYSFSVASDTHTERNMYRTSSSGTRPPLLALMRQVIISILDWSANLPGLNVNAGLFWLQKLHGHLLNIDVFVNICIDKGIPYKVGI